jgi:hypothetical protein
MQFSNFIFLTIYVDIKKLNFVRSTERVTVAFLQKYGSFRLVHSLERRLLIVVQLFECFGSESGVKSKGISQARRGGGGDDVLPRKLVLP